MDFRKLKRNGVVIAEALARYMYNLSDKVDKCMETECVCPSTETVVFHHLFIYLFVYLSSILMCVSSFHNLLQGHAKRCAGLQGPDGNFPRILINMQR